jgi:hypothetical protein
MIRAMHRLRRLLAALMLAAGALGAAPAWGHELTMAELNMRELAHGEFVWSWLAAGGTPVEEELTPRWPDSCVSEEQRLSCPGGLNGKVSVEGVGERYSAALLRITWLDGQRRVYTITEAQPEAMLFGGADDARGRGEIVTAYGMLGVEHILGGIDHLLFVVCLLFLVGFNRRLVWTITAFTVAHSLTLASSALGLLTLRSGPVEATIALSIMLAAVEALRRRETFTQRWPAVVAFLFGLVHGLGFAGALEEIGLPEQHVWIALLTFNLGVEAGQLMVVAAAWLLTRAIGSLPAARAARTPALYLIGVLAAWWSWQRLASIVVAA